MTNLDLVGASADKLAVFLGHGVTPALVQRIQKTPSLRRHLDRLLSSRLGDGANADGVHATAFALDKEGVSQLSYRAGIVWHAAVIAATIEAGAKRALVEDIGEEFYALALDARHAAVAPPCVEISAGSLRSAAMQDGARCVAAWRIAQPQQVADRLWLSWPDLEIADIHRRIAPPIIQWLLAKSRAP